MKNLKRRMICKLIISAFPACGKSYCFNNYQDYFTILDSDSSKFDKQYFPSNYIQHIKDNMDKVDIIFVSSHQSVRDALKENNIPFITIYPEVNCKDEWIKRMKNRGNTDKFIEVQEINWDNWVKNVNPYGNKLYRLQSNQYIDLNILKRIIDERNQI